MGEPKPKAQAEVNNSRCRGCQRETHIARFEYFKANQPRCSACGGLLDYLGSWNRTRRGHKRK
jgi:hypothetical protein